MAWRAYAVAVFLVCIHASMKVENSVAEYWVCPTPEGAEAFTDQGGPGCRKRDDLRPPVHSNSTHPVQQGGQSLDAARQCAGAGDANCMIRVAEVLLSADKTAANLQEVRDWARKAMSKGDQRSGFYLARAYLSDPNNRFIVDGKSDHAKYEALAKRTVAQRAEHMEALEALAASAQAGFIPARLLLAALLYEQSGGTPSERVAQLLNSVPDLPPIYQTLKRNTEVVLALGPSHASPKLVTDAMMTALMGAAGQAQRKDAAACKDMKPVKISGVTSLQEVDWLPLKHPLIVNSYPLKGHWTEDWTVMLCATTYTVHMQFQADGLGGAYHTTQAQPAPLRNVGSLSPDLPSTAREQRAKPTDLQPTGSFSKSSLDEASGYVATQNFLVGRIGRDCLVVLGRSESPQDFVRAWQQRNVKYVSAGDKYMQQRLAEMAATNGPNQRDAAVRNMQSTVRSNVEATIATWLQRVPKEQMCKRSVSLVDAGAMDITRTSPLFNELEALARWAQ